MRKIIFIVLLVALGGILFAQRGQFSGRGREMRRQGNNFQAQPPMRSMGQCGDLNKSFGEQRRFQGSRQPMQMQRGRGQMQMQRGRGMGRGGRGQMQMQRGRGMGRGGRGQMQMQRGRGMGRGGRSPMQMQRGRGIGRGGRDKEPMGKTPDAKKEVE